MTLRRIEAPEAWNATLITNLALSIERFRSALPTGINHLEIHVHFLNCFSYFRARNQAVEFCHFPAIADDVACEATCRFKFLCGEMRTLRN